MLNAKALVESYKNKEKQRVISGMNELKILYWTDDSSDDDEKKELDINRFIKNTNNGN